MVRFYSDPNEPFGNIDNLWRDGQFVFVKKSTVEVLNEGLHEYPLHNNYAPFWKNLGQMKHGDSEIGNCFLNICL